MIQEDSGEEISRDAGDKPVRANDGIFKFWVNDEKVAAE
jgi:hypothetical protein